MVSVRQSDFEVFQALAKDSEDSVNSAQKEYNQDIPVDKPWGAGPPVLPPHLLQVILNKDTPLSVRFTNQILFTCNRMFQSNYCNALNFSVNQHCCLNRITWCWTICMHCPLKTASWYWVLRTDIERNTLRRCCINQSKCRLRTHTLSLET